MRDTALRFVQKDRLETAAHTVLVAPRADSCFETILPSRHDGKEKVIIWKTLVVCSLTLCEVLRDFDVSKLLSKCCKKTDMIKTHVTVQCDKKIEQ